MASVGNDNTIKLWDIESKTELRTFEEVKGGNQLISVDFSPDGKNVFATSSADSAKIWDAETGKLVRDLNHKNGTTFITSTRDGKIFATGGTDGSVILWDAANGKTLGNVSAGTGRVLSIAFSPDGKQIAAASGRSAKVFDTKLRNIQLVLNHDEGIYGISFSPDGKRLVSASSDQTVKLWDTRTGETVLTMPFETSMYGAYFSPDGTRLFVLPIGSEVQVFDSRVKL